MPLVPRPYCLGPCCFLCWMLVQAYSSLWHSRTPLVECSQIRHTDHRLAAGHEAVCFARTKVIPAACALLEFTEAPLCILRVSGLVDIGIPTATSLALDTAAISSLAATLTQTVPTSVPALTCQLAEAHCKLILFRRCARHCIAAQQTCAIQPICFATLCSSMVPGKPA